MFPASDLVHPFETGAGTTSEGLIDGRRLKRSDVAASLARACAYFGIAEPQVYVSARPGHAYAPGAVRIAERSVAELAPDELEALLAHVCGHLVLPAVAGELSADRAAAVYQGSADAITRVIFAEAGDTIHSGSSLDDRAVRVREIQAWTATPGFARLVSSPRMTSLGPLE